MNACPKCDYKPIPEDARYCPNCSTPLEIARVSLMQEVQQNYGSVIGIRTDVVNGDVYGGDIYQVQVYALSESSRSGFGQRPIDENTSPYKYLAPFGPLDAALFKGREVEIRELLLDLGIWRMLVLYGPSGVGKTSLLAAGLIPKILESGALAFHVHDYAQPLAQTLRAALNSSRDQLKLELSESASLADLLGSVTAATQGTIVLVLDQFERLFRPPISHELAAAQINAIIESLKKVEAQYLRLILSVRDDSLVRLSDLQEALPEMFRAFRPLKSFSRNQARQAILEPLEEVTKRIYYEEDFVDQVLIPDLDNLTRLDTDTIHPTHLQIVCHWLYRNAVGLEPPLVTRKLYREDLHGAQGILHGYLQETLVELGEQRALAEKILIAMAMPGASEWVSPNGLHLDGADSKAVGEVLEHLAEAELLLARPSEDGSLYTFAGEPVLDEVYNIAGDEIEQRALAAKELARVWTAWAVHRDLANRVQLRRLAAYGTHLGPSPLECLLLIRSAQSANLPATPWLTSLSNEQGRSLVSQLEGLPAEGAAWYFSESELVDARSLLGIDGGLDQAPTERKSMPYGPMARSAVIAADPATRQTSALALLACEAHTAIDRLNWAIQELLSGLPRRLRRAELRGAMAEASSEVARLNSALPADDRFLVWRWRASRHLRADFEYTLILTLGAAAGAGLGLGLLRFITALLTNKTPGLFFVLNVFFGGLLGGAAALGYLLARPLLLLPPRPSAGSPTRLSGWQYFLPVLLGTSLFGLTQLIVIWTTGRLALSGKGAVFGLGLLAGLGLCLALFLPPQPPFWKQPRSWPWRIAAVALTFGLIQAYFIFSIDVFSSLVILLPAADYRANFIGLSWVSTVPDWYNLVAILDALLAAVLLTSGLLLGAYLAERFYQSWRKP